jgi:hypothetical protein
LAPYFPRPFVMTAPVKASGARESALQHRQAPEARAHAAAG